MPKKSKQNCNPQFNVTVSGGTVRDTALPYTGGWSPDSRFVLLDYTPIPTEAPSVPGAQIFDVSDGTLDNPIVSFPNSDGTFGGLEASPNRDFTKVVLIDEALMTGGPPVFATSLRVRVVSFNGSTVTPVASTIIPDRIASEINDGGEFFAYFTDDNRFVVLAYLDTTLSFKLLLLDANNLSIVSGPLTVATPPAGQGIVFNLYIPFHLCNSSGQTTQYVAVSYSAGILAAGTTTVETLTPPFNIIIYRVDARGFTSVTTTTFPQFVNTVQAFNPFNCCLQKTTLLVTSRSPYLPGQPSLFRNTSHSLSGNGQQGNLRIFSFNGSSLTPLAEENFDTTIIATNWYPDGKTFGLLTTTGPQFGFTEGVDVATFYQLQRNADCSFGIHNIDKFVTTPPGISVPLFSPNGQFLADVGTQIPFSNPAYGPPTESAINNVILYRINSDIQPFQCPNNNKNKKNKKCKC
jgi:hypothetical protein